MRLVRVELEDGHTIDCLSPKDLAIHMGDRCVLESSHVLEYGKITRLTEDAPANESKDPLPTLLRRATLQDQTKARENSIYLKMVKRTCIAKVEEQKLEMQIVDVRHSFDRKVVTISYTAEQRIQFKDLVKELAEELHARIELKQIGVRDAAGVVGGLGPCGRQLCCSSWLHRFEAVTVRMAKNQRLSPNPNTISGVCGRLKCCLRFENACYTELARQLPRDGSPVTCPEGNGVVIDKSILKQRVRVRMDDDNRVCEFSAEQVSVRGHDR